nr:hypothetical protein [Bacteroidota bacterium]
MRKIFQISLWILVTTGVFIVLGFAFTEKGALRCNNLNVEIVDSEVNGFITEAEVLKIIRVKFDMITGRPMDSINTAAIENELRLNPYIHRVDVYTSMTGGISVEIKREVAILRVFNTKNECYYLTADGKPLPLKDNFIPRTMIARGDIKERYKDIVDEYPMFLDQQPSGILAQLHGISAYIHSHPFLSEHIDQIYLNSNSDFELIPCHGRYIIVLGGAKDLESKIYNLMAFYEKGLKKMGIDNIGVINLKYKNQVICKK